MIQDKLMSFVDSFYETWIDKEGVTVADIWDSLELSTNQKLTNPMKAFIDT
jgi:hypothetical protein